MLADNIERDTMDNIQQGILRDWKVVVVDDDLRSLDIACSLLKHYGAQVYQAANGEEGVKLASEHLPDLVITDISMPIMDGWELIRRLKGERATLDIPIIALTAHAMPGHRTRAIAAGCHNYLTKPLTPYTFIKDLLILLVDIPSLAIRLQTT